MKGYRAIIFLPVFLFWIIGVCLIYVSNASGQIIIVVPEEFQPPDFTNWTLEKTEKVEHPTNTNLSATIQKFKKPDANEWLVLTTEFSKLHEFTAREIRYFKPEENNPNIVDLYIATSIADESWTLDGRYPRSMSEEELKQLPKIVDNYVNDYISKKGRPVTPKTKGPVKL